jgi:hypothetical protein
LATRTREARLIPSGLLAFRVRLLDSPVPPA